MPIENTRNIQVIPGGLEVNRAGRADYPDGTPEVPDFEGGVTAAHVLSRTIGAKGTFPLTDTESIGIEGDLAFMKTAIEIGRKNGMQGEELKHFATRCADDMMRAFVEQLSKSA
jgi:hypothetical protein